MPLDPAHLVLEALVERQHVLRGYADRVALELDGVQMRGLIREEDLATAGAAHQLHLLAGRVAHDPAGEARALIAELDLALVEHHAALTGEHRLVAGAEVDADQLLVLQSPPLTGGRLAERRERGGNTGSTSALRHTLRCPVRRRSALLAGELTGRLLPVAGRRGRLTVARGWGRCLGLLPVAGRRGRLTVARGRGRGLPGHLSDGRRVRAGRGRRLHGAGRCGQRRDDRRRGVHRRRSGGGSGRRRGSLRRRVALLGGRGRRGRAERRWRGLRGRRERRRTGLLLRRRGGGLLLGDLTAEVLQQRVESTVEPLPDGREPPDVLQVEVAQHDSTFGRELRAVERIAGDLFTARDDPYVSGGDLRHLPRTVDRRGERELLDVRRDPVESDAEGLAVAGLRTEKLNRLLGRFRLVEEDEIPVVREPFVGIETEAADVEGQPGPRDLHAYVQIRARGEVTDPGLVAALEFPGHT